MSETDAGYFVLALCSLLLAFDGVFGDTDEVKSVMEGDRVSLNTDVTIQKHDIILWYFNDTRIALINGEASKSCVYDGEDGRFRDRLEVDYETRILTIRDITSEHAGLYEAEIIRRASSGTSQSLNRNSKCDSTKIIRKNSNMGDTIKTFNVTVSAADLNKADSQKDIEEPETDKTSGPSAGGVAGIAVAVLVFAAAGVIYYRHRRRVKADEERRKQDVL